MPDVEILWEGEVKNKFDIFISKMPLFHRRIAEKLVTEKAAVNAKERKSSAINEEDLLNAVFSEVPHPFYTVMVRLLDELEFDYKKYGLPKVSNQ